jgi:hypothetical protein
MQITLTKEAAQDILWENEGEIVRDIITGKSRWSIRHELIFKLNDKYYRTTYQEGATEYQDEQPWQYETEIKCIEVEPFKELVTNFKPIE